VPKRLNLPQPPVELVPTREILAHHFSTNMLGILQSLRLTAAGCGAWLWRLIRFLIPIGVVATTHSEEHDQGTDPRNEGLAFGVPVTAARMRDIASAKSISWRSAKPPVGAAIERRL
jgi:hypothetical protein